MEQPAILVVDDEPDLLPLMMRILARKGYRVTTANGVTQALDSLAAMAAPPDLLITDLSMPDGRGADLADTIRQHNGAISVLYVSGFTRERAVADGLMPADGALLEKPFNPTQLASAAEAALAATRSSLSRRSCSCGLTQTRSKSVKLGDHDCKIDAIMKGRASRPASRPGPRVRQLAGPPRRTASPAG
jgi:DNA-binding response OmpR family regulator